MKILSRSYFLFIFFILTSSAFAGALGTTGKISGKVIDVTTNEPLPFVNVIIEGTSLGATTDADGYYAILNISPGTYNVKATYIGYQAISYKGVKVSIDLTTKIDFSFHRRM
jgi:hypothetical protein